MAEASKKKEDEDVPQDHSDDEDEIEEDKPKPKKRKPIQFAMQKYLAARTQGFIINVFTVFVEQYACTDEKRPTDISKHI